MDNVIKKNNWKLLVGLLILVLGLNYGVQKVQQSQENRSNAASENELQSTEVKIESICGKSEGKLVSARPISDLCDSGLPVWNDSVAEDGDYNWSCINEDSMSIVACSAFLED